MRLKTTQVAAFKKALLAKQNGLCRLCEISLSGFDPSDMCLDHCHTTGDIRGILCRNCNGIEGKVYNLANRAKRHSTPLGWIERLVKYWKDTKENPSGIWHPTHKTADEKRLLRNKRARLKRARNKK